MGRITATIPDELEKKFKHKMIDEFGGKRGDISKAIEEAISKWVKDGK